VKPKVVVCASGDGSNFQALVEASRTGELDAQIVGLIASRAKIGAIGRARLLDIPFKVLSPLKFSSRKAWDAAMLKQLQLWEAEWVALAGFLSLIGKSVLSAYPKRILNSHPALLPKYGGKGMYGDHVHAAVLTAGDKETGLTFHWVDAQYDHGDNIQQFRIPTRDGDTIDSLAERVKREENRLYPKVLEDLIRQSTPRQS